VRLYFSRNAKEIIKIVEGLEEIDNGLHETNAIVITNAGQENV